MVISQMDEAQRAPCQVHKVQKASHYVVGLRKVRFRGHIPRWMRSQVDEAKRTFSQVTAALLRRVRLIGDLFAKMRLPS